MQCIEKNKDGKLTPTAALLTLSFCLFACCASGLGAFPRTEGIAYADTIIQAVPTQDQAKPPVTEAESIRMTRFGDPSYTNGASSKGIVAKFSPDGKHFVVVLRKGNLEQNTNEYSVLLFQTARVLHASSPRVLVLLASSSNRPAIKNVAWLGDNDTILFLGEHPGEQTQLYSVKCSTGVLRRLTNHSTNLSSFASTAKGDRIVYSAESPSYNFVTASTQHRGIHITHEALSDLIRGSSGGEYSAHELFVIEPGAKREVSVRIEGGLTFADAQISLSPDGRYFVVQTEAHRTPVTWSEYDDKFLRTLLSHRALSGGHIPVYQYELVDTRTGASRALIDAPIRPNWGSEIAWSPDSLSLAVSDAYLPLNVDGQAERAIRISNTFLVEIKVPSREFVKITDKDLRLIRWEPRKDYLICELGRLDSLNGKPVPKIYFGRKGDTWSQLEGIDTTEDVSLRQPDIVLEENMNVPPRIVAVDPANGQRALIMDLNPQFSGLAFGKVEEVKWKDALNGEVKGGLYWPPDFVPGQRYPLVIQTHGFTSERFWIDGPWTTAFAAQALAGKGFFVLQVPDPDWHSWDTSEEAPRAMAAYEGAIDYLDQKGLIDAHRVGIIGFSRSCFYVTYTLTHSKYDFMAAVIADGATAGYFQYMVMANVYPTVANEFEAINGAPPFGQGLSLWMKNSPEFLMDKVRTPLMIQAIGPASLLDEWSWFSGMSRLGKPVDLIYIPDGVHILEKPWERLISQQGTIDWFCFWLKDEEDPDPVKTEQYIRWRELRPNSSNP